MAQITTWCLPPSSHPPWPWPWSRGPLTCSYRSWWTSLVLNKWTETLSWMITCQRYDWRSETELYDYGMTALAYTFSVPQSHWQFCHGMAPEAPYQGIPDRRAKEAQICVSLEWNRTAAIFVGSPCQLSWWRSTPGRQPCCQYVQQSIWVSWRIPAVSWEKLSGMHYADIAK